MRIAISKDKKTGDALQGLMRSQPFYHCGHQRGRTDNERRTGLGMSASPAVHRPFEIFAARMHLHFDVYLAHRYSRRPDNHVRAVCMSLIRLDGECASEAPKHAIDFINGTVMPSLLPLCFRALFHCHEH